MELLTNAFVISGIAYCTVVHRKKLDVNLSQYLPAPPRKYCAKRNSLRYNKCQHAQDNWCHSPTKGPFPVCGNPMIRPQEEFLIKCLEIF